MKIYYAVFHRKDVTESALCLWSHNKHHAFAWAAQLNRSRNEDESVNFFWHTRAQADIKFPDSEWAIVDLERSPKDTLSNAAKLETSPMEVTLTKEDLFKRVVVLEDERSQLKNILGDGDVALLAVRIRRLRDEAAGMTDHLGKEIQRLSRERDESRALMGILYEALERCYEQLGDQQAMQDDSSDAFYEKALEQGRKALYEKEQVEIQAQAWQRKRDRAQAELGKLIEVAKQGDTDELNYLIRRYEDGEDILDEVPLYENGDDLKADCAKCKTTEKNVEKLMKELTELRTFKHEMQKLVDALTKKK